MQYTCPKCGAIGGGSDNAHYFCHVCPTYELMLPSNNGKIYPSYLKLGELKEAPKQEPKSLIDSAMELLYFKSVSPEDIAHLKWIYARMVEVHGETPNVDYMIKMREILGISEPAPVYEWEWKNSKCGYGGFECRTSFMTDNEYLSNKGFIKDYEKDESTKRERTK